MGEQNNNQSENQKKVYTSEAKPQGDPVATGPSSPKTPGNDQKKKNLIIGIAAAIVVLILIIVLVVLNKKPQEEPASIEEAPASVSAEPVPVIEPEIQEIDFPGLKAQNEDIIAWVRVPGTVIDYPIVRGLDNSYYLTNDEFKQPYEGGAIFTDMINAEDFSDPVTVTYGHYMPDGSLYTQLHDFRDPDFFAENTEVVIFLPLEKLEYEIVGAFNIGEENILYNKDYTKEEDMQGFVDWLNETRDLSANIRTEDAGLDDQYFVMSTCQAIDDNTSRFIVVARLVESTPMKIVMPNDGEAVNAQAGSAVSEVAAKPEETDE